MLQQQNQLAELTNQISNYLTNYFFQGTTLSANQLEKINEVSGRFAGILPQEANTMFQKSNDLAQLPNGGAEVVQSIQQSIITSTNLNVVTPYKGLFAQLYHLGMSTTNSVISGTPVDLLNVNQSVSNLALFNHKKLQTKLMLGAEQYPNYQAINPVRVEDVDKSVVIMKQLFNFLNNQASEIMVTLLNYMNVLNNNIQMTSAAYMDICVTVVFASILPLCFKYGLFDLYFNSYNSIQGKLASLLHNFFGGFAFFNTRYMQATGRIREMFENSDSTMLGLQLYQTCTLTAITAIAIYVFFKLKNFEALLDRFKDFFNPFKIAQFLANTPAHLLIPSLLAIAVGLGFPGIPPLPPFPQFPQQLPRLPPFPQLPRLPRFPRR